MPCTPAVCGRLAVPVEAGRGWIKAGPGQALRKENTLPQSRPRSATLLCSTYSDHLPPRRAAIDRRRIVAVDASPPISCEPTHSQIRWRVNILQHTLTRILLEPCPGHGQPLAHVLDRYGAGATPT